MQSVCRGQRKLSLGQRRNLEREKLGMPNCEVWKPAQTLRVQRREDVTKLRYKNMAASSSSTKRRTTGRRTSRTTGKSMSKSTEGTVKIENPENGKATEMSKDLEIETKSAKSESVANSAPTQIQVAQTRAIMPNRPIEESHIEVVGTLMGNRPIFKSDSVSAITLVQSEESVGVMANRPIATTNLQITSMTMNRPIASNQIDDPYTLMGYLD